MSQTFMADSRHWTKDELDTADSAAFHVVFPRPLAPRTFKHLSCTQSSYPKGNEP